MTTADAKPTCFIAMPITTQEDEVKRYGDDSEHWLHVMETIHVPAVKAAGFEPIRPVVSGSYLIHGEIIRHLSTADMVLCDLSGLNPNVFFELGVRTSLNLPIALVKDEHFKLPFDTSGINTHGYASSLRSWDTLGEIEKLAQYLKDSVTSSAGSNPMWRQFGLMIAAQGPESIESSADARMELMFESVNALRNEVSALSRRSYPGSQTYPDELLDLSPEFARASDGVFSVVIRFAEKAKVLLNSELDAVGPILSGMYELHYLKRKGSRGFLSTDDHHALMELAMSSGLYVRGIDDSERDATIKVELAG